MRHARLTTGLLGASALAVSGFAFAPAEAAAPLCFGQVPTIVGTAGNDVLTGRADVRDVIYGGGGNDSISGGEFYDAGTAPDLLCGGPGKDRLVGARGNDKLNGGDGDDVVDGTNGADVEQGNAGNDLVGGGSFEDADRAADVMRGGDGNDVMYPGWGKDKVYGDAGADQLYDQECDGPTVLDGGGGNDYLESFSSSFEGYGTVCPAGSTGDTLTGGVGTDTVKVDRLDSLMSVENVTRVRG
jgi:Ca2+-binding RTX toxin-like protein